MEQFRQDDKPIKEKLEENKSSQESKVQDSNKQKKFEIPENVKSGTAKMVGYELRNSILKTEELLEKDPEDKKIKEGLEKLKMEKAMLEGDGISQRRRERIISDDFNKEDLAPDELSKREANFSALTLSALVQKYFIDRFNANKEKRFTRDNMEENRGSSLEIEKLLEAANSLRAKLIKEGLAGDNKSMAEANEKKAIEDAMADVRRKIEDINPNEAKGQENKDRRIKTPVMDFENDKKKSEEHLFTVLSRASTFSEIETYIDVFEISDDVLKSEKFHQAAEFAVKKFIEDDKMEDAKDIVKTFGLGSIDVYKKISLKESKSLENREKEQREIIENVLKKGGFEGTMVYEWPETVKGLERDGHRQMFHRINRETAGSPMYMMKYWMSEKDSGKLEDLMSENNINEVVNVEYVKKNVYKKQIKGKGIIDRILHGKEVEQVFDHSEKVKHSEVVENSKEEGLAVKITYFIQKKDWITKPYGRTGQNLRVEIVMPESDAKKISEEIKKDPKFIRALSDEIMKNKILRSPEEWEKDRGDGYTIRPPYENWDQKGGKMCIMINEAERGLEKKDIREMKNY